MVTESSVGGAALAGLEIKSLVTPPTKVISSQDPIAAAKIQERWTEEERDFVCWFRRKAVQYNNISAFLHHHFKVRRDGADIAKEYNDLASNSENIAERIRSAQTKGWSKTGYFKDLLPVANKLSTTLKRIKRNEKQDRKLSKRQANEDTKRKRQRLGNGSNKTAVSMAGP